jgi:SAM-dependent methyltransferase
MTGYFQKTAHRLLDRWTYEYKDGIVLEIGCGHGHHLVYGQNNYRNYIGLDIEFKYLNILHQRFPATRIVNGDAYQLPFKDRSIDGVLLIYNFEHLEQLPDGLKEIRRSRAGARQYASNCPAVGYRTGTGNRIQHSAPSSLSAIFRRSCAPKFVVLQPAYDQPAGVCEFRHGSARRNCARN